jgi:hypothetical protein
MKKISEWLNELDGHGIYEAVPMAKEFTEETGETPDVWPIHTTKQTRKIMRDRGLGGTLDAKFDSQLVYGYELAATLARKYANGYRSRYIGRGSSFRDCVEAIREAGK